MSNTDQHHHELTDLFTGISQTVNDTRVYQTRDVNTLYTFPGYTKAEWMAKAAELREHILVSNGLTPMPEKTPLNAHVFGGLNARIIPLRRPTLKPIPVFSPPETFTVRKGMKGPFPGHCQSARTLGQRTAGEQRSRFRARPLYQLCQTGLRNLFV